MLPIRRPTCICIRSSLSLTWGRDGEHAQAQHGTGKLHPPMSHLAGNGDRSHRILPWFSRRPSWAVALHRGYIGHPALLCWYWRRRSPDPLIFFLSSSFFRKNFLLFFRIKWSAVDLVCPSRRPRVWMKTVRIFSDRIRDRIRLEDFRSVRIRVRIFNIRYRIRIQILKSHIYDVDI
jgi:hypothetical protein